MMCSALSLGMANEDVDTLLKEFGSASGILKQQDRHQDVGSHLVETACEEILKILVALLLHIVECILIRSMSLAIRARIGAAHSQIGRSIISFIIERYVPLVM